jgi:hypothetical protein
MSKSIIIAVLGSSITLIFSIFASSAPVNASFCIFDCAAVDLKNRLEANAVLQEQQDLTNIILYG